MKQLHEGLDLDRIIMSLSNNKDLHDRITLRDIFQHLMVLASTGMNKTSTLAYYLVRSLLQPTKNPAHRVGMVFFIYKSSDTQLFEQWAKEQGREDDIVMVNADDKDVFNLLEHYQDKEAISAVETLMVLQGLSLGGASGGSEAFWETAMRTRLHRLITLNQLSGEKLNIHTLYQLHHSAPQTIEQAKDEKFTEDSLCYKLMGKALANVGENHPQFKLLDSYFGKEMPNLNNKTLSSILSMTDSVLAPFINSPMLSNIFCGETTLSLDEVLQGKILILNLPIQKHEFSAKIAQMMFKHLLQKKIESRDVTQSTNPCILFLDEFQHYISVYDSLFLSTARSSNAGCILMTQNINNLYAQISKGGKNSDAKVNALLALCNHKFFLAQNDSITNEFASKMIGMVRRSLGNNSIDTEALKVNTGSSESYHYAIMPREFSMLRSGGKKYKGIVDAVVVGTGKRFSNHQNFLKISLKQPWYQKKSFLGI